MRALGVLSMAGLMLATGCASAPDRGPTLTQADCAASAENVAALAAPVTRSSPASVPVLRLSPASLGRTLSLQQQLSVTARGQTQRIEVLLEADDKAVRLALVSLGQTAARLEWDGVSLKETRATWLPAAVSAERILSDLQLVMWPAEAVRQALPAGWTLQADVQQRVLAQGGETVTTVRFPQPGRADLTQSRDGYELRIDSRDLSGGAP
ncbi:MAG: hypothetical protein RLZZ618_654 [Pseudomonadota bacterium]